MWARRYFSKGWFPCLFLAVVTLLVWGRTIRYDFVWDDYVFIVKNPNIRSLKEVPAMFYSLKTQSIVPDEARIFRPLRTAQYAVLCALEGKQAPRPWLFHLANLLWHAAAAMLLFSVALLLYQRQAGEVANFARAMALLVATAFAIHPVTSEVVCWAKSLDDTMAAVFVLAATLALLKWKEDNRSIWASLGCFVLAVYSKESAVPFALFAFFVFLGLHRLSWRRSAKLSLGFFVVALAYTIHRHLVIGQSTQSAPLSGSYGQTLVDMLPVAGKYFRLLWGLPPFCIDYSYMTGQNPPVSWSVLSGAALLVLCVGLGTWLWRKRDLAVFGLLWLGLFFLPVSNLVPMMQYMAERFLYLPLIGFLLMLGALLLKSRRPLPALALSSVLLVVWGSASWNRMEIWQDELTLFTRSWVEGPRSSRMEKNAVIAIFRLPHVRQLFPIDPEKETMSQNSAISRDDAAPALQTLTEAHRLFPTNEVVASALGLTRAAMGQFPEAIELLAWAVHRNPGSAQYQVNLGTVLAENNQNMEAREVFDAALRLEPANANALRGCIRLAWKTEDFQTALRCARRLQQLEPQNGQNMLLVREIERKISTR